MDLKELASLQLRMAKKLVLRDGFSRIRHIAGVDVAYLHDIGHAAAAVLRYGDMHPVEIKSVAVNVSFPYIPGYLSFREAGPMKAAISALQGGFDVLLVNGHGIAHPRGLGIASHLGVELRVPTVGVARRLLCGEVVEGGGEEIRPVVYRGRIVGFRLLSGKGKKPLYVSPGNLVSLKSSLRIIRECVRGHVLPEPLYLAHQAASDAKKKTGAT